MSRKNVENYFFFLPNLYPSFVLTVIDEMPQTEEFDIVTRDTFGSIFLIQFAACDLPAPGLEITRTLNVFRGDEFFIGWYS